MVLHVFVLRLKSLLDGVIVIPVALVVDVFVTVMVGQLPPGRRPILEGVTVKLADAGGGVLLLITLSPFPAEGREQ